ncbi:MAG: mechanosensitive ion channel [Planctomycetota bacterium]|jgi:miniconductance mechanosensitive channel|nr:mechanosensitive ion channel [Planctomycetota bacterium]
MNLKGLITDLLGDTLGLESFWVETLALPLGVLALFVAAWIANFVAKRLMLRLIKSFAKRTRSTLDDDLIASRVFDRLSHIAPALVLYLFSTSFVGEWILISTLLARISFAYIAIVGAAVSDAMLNFLVARARKVPSLEDKPVKSWVQVIKILVWLFAAIVVLATLFDRSPMALLGGLGALTAVLMLVFKDSILGLVASIQIATQDLVRLGDWIEVPKFGADGDVIDISLNTVRVQNWDKTIATIPTYALLSDSFKNWRGMSESGGRRIKRSVRIDMNSIRFLSPEDFEKLMKVQAISPYLQEKEGELSKWNQEKGTDESSPVNGRRLTNVGTFRAYLDCWLRNHPATHGEMTFLVRHLAPDEFGLPIQVYMFSSEQRWAEYEAILADIFDHILAVLPEFSLRVYQRPTGADFRAIIES